MVRSKTEVTTKPTAKDVSLWLLPAEIDAELELMQALAEVDKDEHPNAWVVEILSEDDLEYVK